MDINSLDCVGSCGGIYAPSNTIARTNETMILIGNYQGIHFNIFQSPGHTSFFLFQRQRISYMRVLSLNIFAGGHDYGRDNYSLEVTF